MKKFYILDGEKFGIYDYRLCARNDMFDFICYNCGSKNMGYVKFCWACGIQVCNDYGYDDHPGDFIPNVPPVYSKQFKA